MTALFEQVEIDEAVRPHREDLDLAPLPRQPFDRVEHAGMLGRESDDPAGRRSPFSAQLAASVAPDGEIELPARPPSAASTCSRATSTAAAASRPSLCGLCGLANFSSSQGRIAASASGASGVVA